MLPLISFLIPYIVPIITSLVVDRIAKFGRETDWTKVKQDANAKIKSFLPDAVFSPAVEDAVCLYVDRRISALAAALQDKTKEEALIKMVAASQFESAFKLILNWAFPGVKL